MQSAANDENSEPDFVLGPFQDDILVDPAALGILRCLRMLAAEAAGLELTATSRALAHVMAICAADQPGWVDAPQPRALRVATH